MSALDDVILADGPAFFWPLDETSGDVANDISGNGLHGFYNGSPELGVPGPASCQETDLAVRLSGDGTTPATADFVGRETSPISGTGDFTLEVWVSQDVAAFDNPRRYQNIIQQRLDASRNYAGMMRVYTNAAFPETPTGFGLAVNDDQPSVNADLAVLDARVGCWSHVAVTRASGVMNLWFNAISLGSFSSGFSLSPNYLSFGADWPNIIGDPAGNPLEEWELFRGRMAKAAGFDHALSPARLAARISAGCMACGPSGFQVGKVLFGQGGLA